MTFILLVGVMHAGNLHMLLIRFYSKQRIILREILLLRVNDLLLTKPFVYDSHEQACDLTGCEAQSLIKP